MVDLKELKKALVYLKRGATKDTFVPFGVFLCSDGKKVWTFNYDTFVTVNIQLPFSGLVNIFILDNILKTVSNDAVVKIEDEKLLISEGTIKSSLTIVEFSSQIDFFEKPVVPLLSVTNSLIEDFKTALNFVDNKSFLFMDNYCIMSVKADGSGAFCKLIESGIKTVGVTSEIVSIFSEGNKIGGVDENVVVEFEKGYAIFSVPLTSDFPYVKLKSIFNSTIHNNKSFLCNLAVIKDAITKLSAIFSNDKDSDMKIENVKKELKITASSSFNDKVEIDYSTQLEQEYKVSIDYSLFKGVPLDYNVLVGNKANRSMLLTNGDSNIILMIRE